MRKITIAMVTVLVLVSLVATVSISAGLVKASTLYFSETCPHCQNVLDNAELNRLLCLDKCNTKNKECQKYSGVPVLEHNEEVLRGDKPIIEYTQDLPYYSKIPSEEDKIVGEHKVGNIVYELWQQPDGNKFLGRDIKSVME